MTIGEYIRTLRQHQGWSLRDLSARAGDLSISFLSDLERGRSDPSLTTLQLLSKAFDLGAGDLLVQAGYTVHPEYEMLRTATVKVVLSGNGSASAEVVSNKGK